MTLTCTRPVRRALAVPATVAMIAGGLAATTGLLSPQRASAINVSCPVLVQDPQTFATGEHCFTIPSNVTSIHAVLVGGSGGSGAAGQAAVIGVDARPAQAAVNPGAGGAGGHGMEVSGDVAVTPGQVVWTYVAGNGQGGADGGAGGFNGGAQGGHGVDFANSAGGGGGATDLRLTQATSPFTSCGGDASSAGNFAAGPATVSGVSNFLLVAGGGGGGGNGADTFNTEIPARTGSLVTTTPDGGNGGSQPGDANPPSAGSAGLPAGGDGGGPGTASSGGTGGAGVGSAAYAGDDGQTRSNDNPSGCGGQGGDATDSKANGGGGGGGYNGGGGGGGGNTVCVGACEFARPMVALQTLGGAGGGGGGSNYHSSAVTNMTSSIAGTGPSATITFKVNATPAPSPRPTPSPTAQVQAVTTPSTGSGGSPVGAGVALLLGGAVLMGALTVGRRRHEV